MTKPIGPVCNLDCRYCYYLEKEKLYPPDQPLRMSDALLETYIRQYIETQPGPEINFAWQGGEPTLLGVEFFRRAVALQQRHANGKTITNALQTNGTLLDDAWCSFFSENGFLVGLSVDGPRELHDAYRVDKRGRPSFDRVMRGLALLQKHQTSYNTITVVNDRNSRHPLDVYRFLKSTGSTFLQFIPLVERQPDAAARELGLDLSLPPVAGEKPAGEATPVTAWSVKPEMYGDFLIAIFEEWVRRDVGRIFVQLFDVALGNTIGTGGGLCVFAETCGRALAMEHNGDVYACDHYVYPDYRLGTIQDTALGAMVESPQQIKFGNDKRDTLPAYCRTCDVLHLCRGECPKHRFMKTPDGQPGLNYLCAGYKKFFRHITPSLRFMAGCLQGGRAPAEIMRHTLALDRAASGHTPPGRNDPCPCGSGRKFKACCGG